MTTVGEALWHLMGSNVDDLEEAIGVHRDMPLDEFRALLTTSAVWVYYSHQDGYPTPPLAVYASPDAAKIELGGEWTFLPQMSPYRTTDRYTTHTADGVAADLVRIGIRR